MRKILTFLALATCLSCGYGTADAANIYSAVNDTVPENNQSAGKSGKGLGGILGSFLGGGAKEHGGVSVQQNDSDKVCTSPNAKDALGGILGSVLGGAKGQSGDQAGKVGEIVGSIFNGIANSKLSAEMLVGTWDYTSSKCVLEADDIVKKLGSEAMVAPIEKKMNEYLAKAGFRPGNFSYTFNEDGTFTANLNGRPMKGKYTLDVENKTLQLNFFRVVKTTLSLTVVNQQLGMLHDADKLLDLVCGIASKSSSTSVKSLNTILSKYNGLQVGMEFKKKVQ